MSDATLRAARRAALADTTERAAYLARYARVHSPADVLRERVRVGDLRADWLELAARLAHPVAREVHPHVQLIDWTSWIERREFLRPLVEEDRGLVVAWLVDGAERALGHAEGVLAVYESPGDSRPRRAIEAGRDLCAVLRRWVRGEATDGDVREARRAAASYAADAAYYAAAANASSYAAAVAAADAAAASAASDAASYAAYADDAAASSYAAAYAADSAADSAYDDRADAAYAYAAGDRGWVEARDAEHAWRRDRLARYLLGEVTP